MTILLTGFMAFEGVDINPSQKIVAEVHGFGASDIYVEVLPVVFDDAGARIRHLIRTLRPSAVLSLGVAAGREAINLERFALNINDAKIPDNMGRQAHGQAIVPNGAEAYRSTLPLTQMHHALNSRDIPVTYSNHAGAYVCNHVFYCARHEIETLGLNIPCGLIHIPMMREINHPKAENGLPFQTMLDAVLCCLDVLRG